MFLIDTNIHAAYLLQAYEQDEVTKQYLTAYEQIPLINRVVADFVLNELELLLLKAVPPRFHMTPEQEELLKQEVFAYFHDMFTHFTLATPSSQTVKHAYELYQRYAHTKYISFTDSLVLALAEQNNYTILSKDRRLNDIAQQLSIPANSF
jgi:predicted nucleic acid-binding protein